VAAQLAASQEGPNSMSRVSVDDEMENMETQLKFNKVMVTRTMLY
jgi:hypothetical protein